MSTKLGKIATYLNGLLHVKFFFSSIWVFFHNHSRITRLQGKGEGISGTPHYYFHPLHWHLHINRAITADSSPLHIGSSRARTENLWFPSARSRDKQKPLYLHYRSAYGHQNWQVDNLPRWVPTCKSTWPYDPFITLSCEIMWQAKTIISPIPKCLWPPDLVGWGLTLSSSHA